MIKPTNKKSNKKELNVRKKEQKGSKVILTENLKKGTELTEEGPKGKNSHQHNI